ncbi:heme-degrading domain-containing protein [Demequina phytophila]|uniref:heme-degrading domain-containing protein n=1 Tax=Demequina phytophila TaxID=1638981 RepID=UPI000784AE48|nr:heme-binding protein [Demequina phytophila]
MSPAPASDRTDRRAQLEQQHTALSLTRFDLADAWTLGSWVVERALTAGHHIAVDIRRPGHVLFHAALPGATPDNDQWIAQKSTACLRLETATALLALRFAEAGLDPLRGWLPEGALAAGGSVPVRVDGVGVVAALTVSGLASDEDHDLAVAAIEALRESQA